MLVKIKKNFFIAIVILLLGYPVAVIPQENGFDPGLLVSDESFGNYEAFVGPEGIQKILEIRGSVLANTSIEFLKQDQSSFKKRINKINAIINKIQGVEAF